MKQTFLLLKLLYPMMIFFYQKKNPSEVNGATVEPKKEPQGITEEAMLNYMVQNPDFLQKFKVLLGVGN